MPIPDPDQSCGPECLVAHSTVLPVNGDREQLAKHCLVDGLLRGLALWACDGPRGRVVHTIWVDVDGITRQEYVDDVRVRVLAD